MTSGDNGDWLTEEVEMWAPGWKSYPLNLARICDDDLDFYHKRLRNDTARLFRNDRMKLELRVAPNHPNDGLPETQDGPQLHKHPAFEVAQENEFDLAFLSYIVQPGDHIISFYQQHTWAPFSVTQEIFCKILTAHCVRPSFLDVVTAFGFRKDESEEELPEPCSFRVEPSRDPAGLQGPYYNICYSLRYIEKTGRDTHPWSVRRMGIYQRYDFDSASSIWILLQPIPKAKELAASSVGSKSQLLLLRHVLLCSLKIQNWRYYLKDLQQKVREKGQNVRFCNTAIQRPSGIHFEVAFSDIQRLQYLQEVIHDAIMTLKTNIETLNGLKALCESLEIYNLHEAQHDSALTKERIHHCISRFQTYKSWAEDLLDRAGKTSLLTQNLLGFRHDAIISQNSINLAQLAEDSKKDSASLIMLAKATGRDSRAVKLIAIITVIYLPGSFMAVSPQIARKWVSQVDRLAKTIFSTSFVSLASPDSSLPNAEQLKRATVAKEAGAYVATTVGLTLLTMALAYVWIREQERRERIDQEKASNPVDQA